MLCSKLVKKVKSLEKALKRKSKKVLISKSEGEESEDQGRKIQDIDDDPLVSLVRESIKEKSTDFVTPTKALREAPRRRISPTILDAAKTLFKVASQGVSKEKSTDKGKRYRRRARSIAKKIDTGLDVKKEINTGREEINTGIEEVSTGNTKVDSGTASKRGQREGKAPMIEEDIRATHKTKEQLRQEEAGSEEAINFEQNEQKKKKRSVQFEAQFYTEEDWDTIKAKLEANAELTKDWERICLNKILQSGINQGTWKLSQLKKLKFEEIKEEFDKQNVQRNKVCEKDISEPVGEKVAEVNEEEPVKRIGKRKKQKARKGINVDKSAQEDTETDKDESVEAMDPTPLTTKSDSVKYGTNRPEDAYDRVLWSDLRTMFDPPLNEDAIWSLPLQQKMVSWRSAYVEISLELKDMHEIS
ncbi:hypothetical protein Tco_0328108 [Tanacetum coccineum]